MKLGIHQNKDLPWEYNIVPRVHLMMPQSAPAIVEEERYIPLLVQLTMPIDTT